MSNELLQNPPKAMTLFEDAEKILMWFFGGAFILFLLLYSIRPLHDPDFWWHLKSGAAMVENGGLLQSDPFTFTGDGVVTARETFILKGYWLWQLTAYGLYALLGFNGILLLNFLTVSSMAGVVILQLRRHRVHFALSALLLTSGFFLVVMTYALERPHVISFLFTAILLVLLDRIRTGGRFGWGLPCLMMLWSNLHGGFVVGDLVLFCFAAGAVIEYRQDLPRLRQLLLWSGLGIIASFLNPTGALVFTGLVSFHNSALMTGVNEYRSSLAAFQEGLWYVVIVWMLVALYWAATWWARRLYWPELVIALFLSYFSVAYMRNVGFFAVAMLPLIGICLQEGISNRQKHFPPLLSLLALTLCTSFLLWISFGLWQAQQGSRRVKAIYPEKAIDFILEQKLEGRMFNDYAYGGYLLWRLSPQIQVFIDGRGLQEKVFDDYLKITAASPAWVEGRREYEKLLDHYAIDYIIQPIYDGDGNIQPLMKSILAKPEWVPIYLDTTVYILARVNSKNAEAINTCRIEKGEFKTRLLLMINYISQSSPQEVGYQIARAGILIYLGMYDDAKAQVEAIAAVAPRSRSLPGLIRELGILQGQRLRQ